MWSIDTTTLTIAFIPLFSFLFFLRSFFFVCHKFLSSSVLYVRMWMLLLLFSNATHILFHFSLIHLLSYDSIVYLLNFETNFLKRPFSPNIHDDDDTRCFRLKYERAHHRVRIARNTWADSRKGFASPVCPMKGSRWVCVCVCEREGKREAKNGPCTIICGESFLKVKSWL